MKMRVKLILTAEIEVKARKGQDPKALARRKLDQFREAVLPTEFGVYLYEAGGEPSPKDKVRLSKEYRDFVRKTFGG
jgi:hypothetical protein